MKVYGYARVSTAKQKIDRQIENIRKYDPEAIIFQESFTGTKISRPEFDKLLKVVKEGDTLVFDEISRMSRTATEGFELYQKMYAEGIHLVFLKERTLDTENYRETAQIALTGTEVDCILEGINKYLMILAEKQIRAAFDGAEHEVAFLHQRTKEGRAKGKKGGIEKGRTLVTKKSLAAKEVILKHCKDFGGSLSDIDCMKLAGITHNSFYKYKAELKAREHGIMQSNSPKRKTTS